MCLLCIPFWLHSECQALLNRTGSRSSWRQEQTLAGTEAGSHCGLAGLLREEARPLLSAHGTRTAGADTASEGLNGFGCEMLWKLSAHSPCTLCSLECCISKFCFRHVLFPLLKRVYMYCTWPEPKISSV